MKKVVAVMAFALMASTAMAQPYFVAGSMQGWDPGSSQMNEIAAGLHYQLDFPGQSGDQSFKVTVGDWSADWPGSNAQADMGAARAATLTVDFYPATATDGWSPSDNRVGFTDLGLTSWGIIGDFDGWGADQAIMTPLGGGLYSGTFVVATAGAHQFKFRRAGDWSLSNGFEPGATGTGGNAVITTAVDNQTVVIEMDIPGGRYRLSLSRQRWLCWGLARWL